MFLTIFGLCGQPRSFAQSKPDTWQVGASFVQSQHLPTEQAWRFLETKTYTLNHPSVCLNRECSVDLCVLVVNVDVDGGSSSEMFSSPKRMMQSFSPTTTSTSGDTMHSLKASRSLSLERRSHFAKRHHISLFCTSKQPQLCLFLFQCFEQQSIGWELFCGRKHTSCSSSCPSPESTQQQQLPLHFLLPQHVPFLHLSSARSLLVWSSQKKHTKSTLRQ